MLIIAWGRYRGVETGSTDPTPPSPAVVPTGNATEASGTSIFIAPHGAREPGQ